MIDLSFAALYERLSRDDELQGESNSITNQKRLLENYARDHGITNFVHYTDDGISGTRFDRPGFMTMMSEVNDGHIHMICVKDMSRIGRDYHKVGEVRKMLRKRGVHLVAVNDNVDSENGDDDFIPFRNIMNEWYCLLFYRLPLDILINHGTTAAPIAKPAAATTLPVLFFLLFAVAPLGTVTTTGTISCVSTSSCCTCSACGRMLKPSFV